MAEWAEQPACGHGGRLMAARVLIIDDEEAIRFSLRGILEDEGMEVLEASDAESGLALADGEALDLVFLDI